MTERRPSEAMWSGTRPYCLVIALAACACVGSGSADRQPSQNWVRGIPQAGDEPGMSYERQTLRRRGDTLTVRVRFDLPRAVPPVDDSTLRIDRIEHSVVVDCRSERVLQNVPDARYYLRGRLVPLGPLPPGDWVEGPDPSTNEARDPIAAALCEG